MINYGSSGKCLPPANEVMSVCLSVCLSVHKRGLGPMWPLPMMHWTSPCRDPEHIQTCSQSRGTPPIPPEHVQTCSLWSTYSCQAGGWYPTEMISCLYMIWHFVSLRAKGKVTLVKMVTISVALISKTPFSHNNELASRYHMVCCSINRYINNRCLKLNFSVLFVFQALNQGSFQFPYMVFK